MLLEHDADACLVGRLGEELVTASRLRDLKRVFIVAELFFEALIFCSPTPAKLADLRSCLSEMFNADVPEEDVKNAIQRIEDQRREYAPSVELLRLLRVTTGAED